MDNREGIKPESLDPQGRHSDANGGSANSVRAGDPPPTDVDTLGIEEAEPEPGFFTPSNLVMLAMMAAMGVFLFTRFNLEEMWNIAKAGLGLSFVIFIHELGHFAAAKWCGVNVTAFSIGFGPPIPGCWFKWGETTYKLAILPLGGYVQMVGQVDGDEASDDGDDPRSYRRKSVGQRMLIISAGVIMNALLAIVCFIAVYQGPGREHPSGVINYLDSNGPVFKEGVPTGALIKDIGGIEDPNFTDLKYTVIFSTSGEKIVLKYQLEDKKIHEIEIESRKDKTDKMRAIGVGHPSKLKFIPKRDSADGPFIPGSAAAEAKFEPGDVIVGMTDPYDAAQQKKYDANLVTPLPADWRYPGKGQHDYFEFMRRVQLLADKEIVVRVKRGTEGSAKEVDVAVKPMFRINPGVVMQMGPILTVRKGSEAAEKLRGPTEIRDPKDATIIQKKLEGDFIKSISVKEADGKVLEFTYFEDKDEKNDKRPDPSTWLDPERLPTQLRAWSDRLDRAGFKGDRTVTLNIERHRESGNPQREMIPVALKWDNERRFDRVLPLGLNSPLAIPELGFAYQIRAVVVGVTDKESNFKYGDVVLNAKFDVKTFKEDKPMDWRFKKDLDEGQYAFVSNDLFETPFQFLKLTYKVKRGQETVEVEVPLKTDEKMPLVERGWALASDTRRVKADGPLDAIQLGFTDTHRRMMEVFLTVRGILRGDISPEVMGGPFTIAYGAYRFAGLDFGEFIFFLGLISINLSVVNFLPIPVLDGGHMVFLIYEKIRGKPASEAVRVWATYAGLLIIACLMFFVFYLDFNRFFF